MWKEQVLSGPTVISSFALVVLFSLQLLADGCESVLSRGANSQMLGLIESSSKGVFMEGKSKLWLGYRNAFIVKLEAIKAKHDLEWPSGLMADFLAMDGAIAEALLSLNRGDTVAYHEAYNWILSKRLIGVSPASARFDSLLQFTGGTITVFQFQSVLGGVLRQEATSKYLDGIGKLSDLFFREHPSYLRVGYSPYFLPLVYFVYKLEFESGFDRERAEQVVRDLLEVLRIASFNRGRSFDLPQFARIVFDRVKHISSDVYLREAYRNMLSDTTSR